MFCPKCGTQLEAFEAFCHSCGHRVIEEDPAPAVAQEPVFPAEVPASEEPAPAAQEEVVAPKKKSKKKLIIGITAAVTALAVGIGAVAFYFVNHPKVYLRTKVTLYDENGDWINTVEYQYNDQGSPTEIKQTGPDYDYETIIVDDIEIMNRTPNDGRQIRTITYEYNDEGHCVSYEDAYERLHADGYLLEERIYDSTVKCDYKYSYNDDGTIDTVEQRSLTLDGSAGDYEHETVYHYNDEGQLHEISSQRMDGEYNRPFADFRYDSKGRLIVSTVRMFEGMRLWRYEYDKSGNLSALSVSYGICEAAFDDEHISNVTEFDKEFTPSVEAEFEYDSKDRLISRKIRDRDGNLSEEVDLEYDGKFLSCVAFDDDLIIQITDSETEAKKIARKMAENDVVMVRDKHGNIVKAINQDGAYAEYEYEAIRLPKKLAEQHKSIMFSIQRLSLLGGIYDLQAQSYTGGCGLWSYVSFPTNELYEIEVLLRILDGGIRY